MSVPDFETLMLPLLRALGDGKEHSVGTLRDQLATELKLTDQDRAEMLPSGKQALFDNRMGWAKTYMDKAGLISATRRGIYCITDLGRSVFIEKPGNIDKAFLKRFEGFRAFITRAASEEDEDAEANSNQLTSASATPEEVLEKAYKTIRQKVETELLEAVARASPRFFEKLVVELLVKMGYGGTLEDAGRALGRSHDGGLDGIIKEDHLGLDAIYIQAKRWQASVGRPEVQAFAGSLEGERARKGVFITTSSFTSEAREYVRRIEKKIVLIDGRQLTSLMVDFGIGVSPVSSYDIKRVDSDFFSEE